jgi:hypothetical protein
MTIVTELRQIHDDDPEDILHPERVHDWAQDHPGSDLHAHLIWDNEKAGYEFRLVQIRRLIKYYLVTPERKDPLVISLRRDRVSGGGYRHILDVVAVPLLAQMALEEALDDLQRTLRRYEHLAELTGPIAGFRAQLEEIATRLTRPPPSPPPRRGRRRPAERDGVTPA